MFQGRRRRPNRQCDFDYSQSGWYFVTVCTQNRECLFGRIENREMILNAAGLMIQKWWREIPKKFVNLFLDEFIIMPNHLHGIVVIAPVGADLRVGPKSSPFADGGGGHTGPPLLRCEMLLCRVLQWFKTMTTNDYLRQIKHNHWPPFYQRLWQRSFHDHIIHNDKSCLAIREYIRDNPARWLEDVENPFYPKIASP